tara:strand:- start:1150 stop:1539 length:390 start_codon:yes stop_codon:yes gene_type:complete
MRSLQSPTLIRNIAKNLVLKRLESGLTQTQVAQTLGVTFQQAQKFESGNNAMRADQLHIVCKKYNWNMESFFHTPISIKLKAASSSDEEKEKAQSLYDNLMAKVQGKWHKIDNFSKVATKFDKNDIHIS